MLGNNLNPYIMAQVSTQELTRCDNTYIQIAYIFMKNIVNEGKKNVVQTFL